MSVNKNILLSYRGNFTTEKKTPLFRNLKKLQFSGQLLLTTVKSKQWSFYLYKGDIIYATGGIHATRRWLRNLAAYCPDVLSHIPVQQSELSGIDAAGFTTCWEYQLLYLWVAQKKIADTQAAKMIHTVILEVLLEIAQATYVTYQTHPDLSLEQAPFTPLVSIDSAPAIAEFEELWQVWQEFEIADYSPNMAPKIKQYKQLSEHTSTKVYQTLKQLLNGQHTLYDLSVQMKRDVVQVTRSLLQFMQLGWVELVSIPDLPPPIEREISGVPSAIADKPLIACVDDDLWVCKAIEKLATAAGCHFLGVNDGLRAPAILLARKPELIFLDLVMPYTNGYEICRNLRKLPFFSNTPIVILTGNDGVVDQVRAKLFGATDFLSKPVHGEAVLEAIHKHLKSGVTRI
jgi:chemotaxis family two-component system response regulator PixG